MDVLVLQTPEGALLCNECSQYLGEDDTPDGHAQAVHPRDDGPPVVTVMLEEDV